MVSRIESLGAELKPPLLTHSKVPDQPQIQIEQGGSGDKPAARIAKAERRRIGEATGVEPVRDRPVARREIAVTSADGSGVVGGASDIGKVAHQTDTEHFSGCSGVVGCNLPPTRNLPGHSVRQK